MPKIAETGWRVLGAIIDMGALGIVYLIVNLFFAASLIGSIDMVDPNPAQILSSISHVGFLLVFLFAIWFVYFVIMEAYYGKTLGKLICGTRVVRENGKKIDFAQSLVRNLLRIVDGIFMNLIGFIIILVSKKNQRLGDMAANTIVIKE